MIERAYNSLDNKIHHLVNSMMTSFYSHSGLPIYFQSSIPGYRNFFKRFNEVLPDSCKRVLAVPERGLL